MDIKTKMLGYDLASRLQVAVLLVRWQEKEKAEIRDALEYQIQCRDLTIDALKGLKNRDKADGSILFFGKG